MSDILSYFPGIPRPQQKQALLEIERSWNDYDVFVIEAPTAVGKSLCAATLSKWVKDSVILTPTNILLDQYEEDFPEFNYLRRKTLYKCKFNHKECKKKLKACRECEYKNRRQMFLGKGTSVCNYYMYIAMRKNFNFQKSVVILDEAHSIIPTLTEMSAVKLWKHKYKYPNNIQDEGDVISWLESSGLSKRKEIKPVMASLSSEEPDFRFERSTDWYYGEEKELIKARPISIKNAKPILWPWCVQKIILMSATINNKDISELGLDRKRVKFIKTGSPIPTINRPIVYTPLGSFSHDKYKTTLKVAASRIKDILSTHTAKGVIHCTYTISDELRHLLDDDRLIWHNKYNTREKYQEFLRSRSNKVLMACGLSEGIDISNDLGRWQIIIKIPYPSLADTAVYTKQRIDPEWYQWETIRTILQASGRICRHQCDFGVTYIFDSAFEQLYNRSRHLFPDWFSNAII